MNKTTITKQELSVPVGAIMEIADILVEEDMGHQITGTDPDNDSLILEMEYSSDQRDALHAIEDAIDDFLQQEDDGDDDDDDRD